VSKPTAKQIAELKDAAKEVLSATANTAAYAHSLNRLRAVLEAIEKPAPDVTLNTEQELYVIPAAHGYSCLGFDVCLERHKAVAAWLREEGLEADDLPPESRGTIRGYKAYQTLLDRAGTYCRRTAKRCPAELTPQLTGLEGKRVEVIDRHGERRRFQVGKSTGWLPCHLEIARRTSTGGPAVTGAPFQSVRIVA
jgi:hypothetical protein